MQDPPLVLGVPAVASNNLRRSMIIASCMGIVSVIVTGLLGHILMGVFACLGIALGAGNSWVLQRSVVRFGASDEPNKKRMFAKNVAFRFAIITAVAAIVLFFFRPDGLGVVCGLALFQMVMIGGATVPVYKQLKHEASS